MVFMGPLACKSYIGIFRSVVNGSSVWAFFDVEVSVVRCRLFWGSLGVEIFHAGIWVPWHRNLGIFRDSDVGGYYTWTFFDAEVSVVSVVCLVPKSSAWAFFDTVVFSRSLGM